MPAENQTGRTKIMRIGILHYSVPPVIGGVESVIAAHAEQFVRAWISTRIITGRGEGASLPDAVDFVQIPEMDTMHPEIVKATQALKSGEVPNDFTDLKERLVESLAGVTEDCDCLIVHNVLTKHFNLPLTAALIKLLDDHVIRRTLAWCHDLSWTSPNSRKYVFPGYPWALLKTMHENVTYVAISEKRKSEITQSFGCDAEAVPVIHNGVDPQVLYALSSDGLALAEKMNLWPADLILLMPVRITEAKNIELAINVVKELKASGSSPRLIITGPPDPHDSTNMKYYRNLRKLTHELGVDEQVHFVYASGPNPKEGYQIDLSVVAELFRVADVLFMPSHREGFGMPILEAGLLGIPIIATEVPAVQDLHLHESLIFKPDIDPRRLARQILDWTKQKPELVLKARIRKNFTWNALFKNRILPLVIQKS
jgi:glycosyltransferase involved in cell wall biosynthesis